MEHVPADLAEAFDDLEFRFLLHLPQEEFDAPERLFFQIEQVGGLMLVWVQHGTKGVCRRIGFMKTF